MMAVSFDAVSLEIVGGFREKETHLLLASRTGDTRLAIGDQMRGVDHACFEQRQESELHRGRVTARVSDDACALDLRAVDLGESVDRFLEQIGARMRYAVPLLEYRR